MSLVAQPRRGHGRFRTARQPVDTPAPGRSRAAAGHPDPDVVTEYIVVVPSAAQPPTTTGTRSFLRAAAASFTGRALADLVITVVKQWIPLP